MTAEKKVVVLQSNYLPWKGYFDLIKQADLFIFYDDVKFTKNDWRNRNKIKTASGVEWITIPCGQNFKCLINEVEPRGKEWQSDHWRRIESTYSNCEGFQLYKDFFEEFYLAKTWNNLSVLNQYLITSIASRFLGLKTEFRNSTEFNLQGVKSARLIDLLKKADATEYISGPSAREYISEVEFAQANINLRWMDYSNYPIYRQQFPPFEHQVSIIDLLFNEGAEAIHYLANQNSTR